MTVRVGRSILASDAAGESRGELQGRAGGVRKPAYR